MQQSGSDWARQVEFLTLSVKKFEKCLFVRMCVKTHPRNDRRAVFSCHHNCMFVSMVSCAAMSGWPWGILFALKPTLLQSAW